MCNWLTLKYVEDVIPEPSIFKGLVTVPIKLGCARYRVTFDVRVDPQKLPEAGQPLHVWGVVTGVEVSYYKQKFGEALLPLREADVEVAFTKQLSEAERRITCAPNYLGPHILAAMRRAVIKVWDTAKESDDGEGDNESRQA